MSYLIEVLSNILFFSSLAAYFLIRKNFDEEVKHDILKKKVEIECEKINGIHYAWTKHDNQFIGQAVSVGDMAKILINKYPTSAYNLIVEEKQT